MKDSILSQFLCPPGNGVYTVHTGGHHKQALHQTLYQTKDPAIVHQRWLTTLETLFHHNTALLGIPSDAGGGIQRGANWGPLYLRQTLLHMPIQPSYLDLGDIRVIPHLLHDRYLNQDTITRCREALYHDPHSTLPVSPLSISFDVATALYTAHPQLRLFGLGGDHSISYPLVQAFLLHQRAQGYRTAVIHFDAHTDLLAERLGFEYCFGTWAYQILPTLTEPSDLIQIGIRSTGKSKSYWETSLGVQQIWAQEITDTSLPSVCTQLISDLQQKKIERLYISFDIDALDIQFASATGTPEPQGLRPDQALSIINALKSVFLIQSADLVEVAPLVHHPEYPTIKKPQETTLEAAGKILDAMIRK